MALIGPDGNDLPDVLVDGVSAYDFMAINGRVFTEYQREPFAPAFGVGLSQALSSPAISGAVVQRRLSSSFVGDPGYIGIDNLEVTVTGGNTYRIDLSLEAQP